MARDIEFAPTADQELDEAIEFLGATSAAARRFAEAVDAAIERLSEFPESGRPLDDSRRSLYIPKTSYSIIYELVDGKLRILAFAHASRDPGYWRAGNR